MVDKAVNGIIRSPAKISHRPSPTQRPAPKAAFHKKRVPTGRGVVDQRDGEFEQSRAPFGRDEVRAYRVGLRVGAR